MLQEHEQKYDRKNHGGNLLHRRRQWQHPEHQEHGLQDQREHEQPDQEGDEAAAAEDKGRAEKESMHGLYSHAAPALRVKSDAAKRSFFASCCGRSWISGIHRLASDYRHSTPARRDAAQGLRA